MVERINIPGSYAPNYGYSGDVTNVTYGEEPIGNAQGQTPEVPTPQVHQDIELLAQLSGIRTLLHDQYRSRISFIGALDVFEENWRNLKLPEPDIRANAKGVFERYQEPGKQEQVLYAASELVPGLDGAFPRTRVEYLADRGLQRTQRTFTKRFTT